MSGVIAADRLPAPPAGPDGWWEQPRGPAGPPPPPVDPPVDPPVGGGRGPVPGREPGRRAAAVVGGGGALLLLVAVLSVVWPVLAILVLAGAGVALLVRGGLRWAWQAWRVPGSGLRRRVLPATLSAAAFTAAVALLAAPAAAAWALGVLLASLLASACVLVLVDAGRGGRLRSLQGVGGAVGLAAAVLLVVVPAAAVALSVLTVVALLSITGWAMLVAARATRRASPAG